MKIKADYVTNSSSTSYVYWGITEENPEEFAKEAFNNLKYERIVEFTNEEEKDFKEFLEDNEYYDAIEIMMKKLNIKLVVTSMPDSSDYVWIGKSPFAMKDEQTLLEFKNEILSDLEKMCGKGKYNLKDIGAIQESSYNG